MKGQVVALGERRIWKLTNADNKTKRSISENNLLLIIFLNDLFLQLKLGEFSEPCDTSSSLADCKLQL
jgi:hypothetical protein